MAKYEKMLFRINETCQLDQSLFLKKFLGSRGSEA
jgi:hypothetical protein